MITIEVSKRQISKLKKAIEGTKVKLGKEIAIAVRLTANKTKTIVNRNVRKELAVKASDINKLISVSVRKDERRPSATITLKKTARLSLRAFSPRHTKKGVTYRISKSEGRKTAIGAFMGPKPGKLAPKLNGGVFKRVGKKRTPITKLHGASAWGAFKGRKMKLPTKRESKTELKKQIERRINYRVLKKNGAI